MAKGLTYAQLEGYWIAAGGSTQTAPTAAAIALAETGGTGNPAAKNPRDSNGFPSWGLWQINNGNNVAPKDWSKPLGNAKLAVAKYNAAGGFTPWGTYTSGAYHKYMKNNVPPVVPSGNPPIVTTSWVTSVLGGGLASGWQDFAVRLGLILLGGVLLLVGIWLIGGQANAKLEQDIIGSKKDAETS